MKEYPVLFSGLMVEANLSYQKRETRREVKVGRKSIAPDFTSVTYCPDLDCKNAAHRAMGWLKVRDCPYGKEGDVIWVREGFRYIVIAGVWHIQYRVDGSMRTSPELVQKIREKLAQYIAKHQSSKGFDRWMPGIHMCRWGSRIDLLNQGVRIEPLHSIDDVSAINEGALIYQDWQTPEYQQALLIAQKNGIKPPLGMSPRGRFVHLWQSINGRESWDANPWVWVVKFDVQEVKG